MPRLASDRSGELLIAVYAKAERDLRAIVRAAIRRGATGTAAYFDQQRRSAHKAISELGARTPALAGAAILGSYSAGSESTARALGAEAGFTGIDRSAVEVAAHALTGTLQGSLVQVGRSVDDAFRRVVLGEVTQGLARGDTRRAVSSVVARRLLEEGTTGFVDRAGRRWRLDVYSRMAVRTTTRAAVTQGVVNRLEALGEDLVQWSSHANPCPVCEPFDGNTYSLSGDDDRYPEATLLPPGHPNCRHVLIPARASLADFERELGIAG